MFHTCVFLQIWKSETLFFKHGTGKSIFDMYFVITCLTTTKKNRFKWCKFVPVAFKKKLTETNYLPLHDI